MWLHAVCLWQAHWVQLQKDAIRNSVQGVRHSVPLGKPLVMRVGLLRIGNARNDGKNKVAHARTRCVPHGDDGVESS